MERMKSDLFYLFRVERLDFICDYEMPQGFHKILQNRHTQRPFRKQLTFSL